MTATLKEHIETLDNFLASRCSGHHGSCEVPHASADAIRIAVLALVERAEGSALGAEDQEWLEGAARAADKHEKPPENLPWHEAAARYRRILAALSRPALGVTPEFSACCKNCGVAPKIDVGPVNDVICLSLDPQCGCSSVVGYRPGFNVWWERIAALRSAEGAREAMPLAIPEMECERNWPEDFSHENGQYANGCRTCGLTFIGHKRRFTCKVCAASLSRETAEKNAPEVHAARKALEFAIGRVRVDGGTPTPWAEINAYADARIAASAALPAAICKNCGVDV